jgi:hypothetical protein
MREEEEGQKTMCAGQTLQAIDGHAAQLLKNLDPD